MIHFACPSCGAAFDVDDRLAGRVAKCKKCGGRMKIPGEAGQAGSGKPAPREHAASPAGGPRLSPITSAAPARPAAGRPINWLEAVNSQVALAPISMDNMRALRNKPSPMDEPSIPGPYQLASAPSLPAIDAVRGRPAGALTRGYRGGMGKIQKLFRWLNQSAYLVSVPFLLLLIVGLALGNTSLMGLGATGAIVLNIGRIVAGVANLAVIPFRESPIQGILFLIPPITFFYLYQNWHKVHLPVKRIVGPILTIALVAAAFVVEPWIWGESKPKGSIQDQVKSGVGSLKKEMRAQVGKVPNLDVDGLDALQNKAESALESLNAGDAVKAIQGRLQDAAKSIQSQGAAAKPR